MIHQVSAMLSLLRRKRNAQSDDAPIQVPSKGLLLPQPAATLLASPRRQQLIGHIWQRTSLSRAQFASLYRAPLERYAALVQQFPASEAHHHSYPGGMLDHGLEIVAYALRLRQSHLLPVGAPPESQAAQAEAWTAGTAYAALLHDIGKIAVDLHVEYEDGSRWYPWHGPLQRPYRFRFRRDRSYRLHSAAAGLLYADILDPPIMDWLSGFPDLWAALLYVLAGQYEHAGILGELVTQADQASVAQDLGGDPAKARAAPKRTLQRQLIDGLRYLVRELKLNQSHASDGWLTQDALWLVSKTTCDRLRAHLLSHGIEGIPEHNNSMFNLLQDRGIVLAAPNGRAIWRATIVSQSGWSNTFTFLRVSPALIWEVGECPLPFAGSVRIEEQESGNHAGAPAEAVGLESSPSEIPTASEAVSPSTEGSKSIRDLLTVSEDTPSNTMALPTVLVDTEENPACSADRCPQPQSDMEQLNAPGSDEQLGTQFVSWLRASIQSHRIVINDAKALVHTVSGTAFVVSPGTFHRFIQEHPYIAQLARQKKVTVADWEWVQKQFEKLRLHRKQHNGLNIWICEVAAARRTRRLSGYLFLDGHTLFSDLPCDNPYLKLVISTPALKCDTA